MDIESIRFRITGTKRLVMHNGRLADPLDPISFQRQVIPALSIAGCNAGACHGTPSGKNGFKLSLRGFDPELPGQT